MHAISPIDATNRPIVILLRCGRRTDCMRTGYIDSSDREVLRARVVAHDRGRRLLGPELEFLAELDPDLLGVEQLQERLLIREVRARGVAEAEAAAAVALLEELLRVARVVAGDPELAADLLVHVLREPLGEL